MADRIANNAERTRRILDAYKDHIEPDWPTLIFATSVEHAKTLAALLNRQGITARAVSGTTEPATRRRVIEAFRDGAIKALVNYGVFAEGFDAPKTRAIIVARPVNSPNLYFQMIGRGPGGPKNEATSDASSSTSGTTSKASATRSPSQTSTGYGTDEYFRNGVLRYLGAAFANANVPRINGPETPYPHPTLRDTQVPPHHPQPRIPRYTPHPDNHPGTKPPDPAPPSPTTRQPEPPNQPHHTPTYRRTPRHQPRPDPQTPRSTH